MTAASVPVAPGRPPAARRAGSTVLGSGRLLRLELRHIAVGLTVAILGALGWSGARNRPRARLLVAAVTAVGLAASGTAVALAGAGRLDPHGMIVIPALDGAASDQPVRYTPACSHTAIPVCVHPAYAAFLPAVTAAVGSELTEVAGLPGAPARLTQVAEVYQQGPANGITVGTGASSGSAFVLSDQLPGVPGATSADFTSQLEQLP